MTAPPNLPRFLYLLAAVTALASTAAPGATAPNEREHEIRALAEEILALFTGD